MSDIKGLVNIHTGREVQYLAPPGYIYNLQISNNILNPNTQIDIAAGYAKSDDYEGDILLSAPTTLDLTTDIDTGGAPALSKWYYPWLASDRDGNVIGKISESYTTPALPAGFIYKRRVGSFYNDAAGNIRAFEQSGNSNYRRYSVTELNVVTLLNVQLTPLYDTLNLSSYCPAVTSKVLVRQGQNSGSATNAFSLSQTPNSALNRLYQTSTQSTIDSYTGEVRCANQQLFLTKFVNTATTYNLYFLGYSEYL